MMKKLSKKVILGVLFLFLITACDSGTTHNAIPTIDLCGKVNKPSCDNLDQNAWKVREIHFDVTDSTILSNFRVLKIKDDKVWVSDKISIYRFNADNGSCESVFSRMGEGPEEYYSILTAGITDTGDILITDFNTQRLSMYKPDGTFITRSAVRLGDFTPLSGTVRAISFPGASPVGTLAYTLNERLEPVDSLLIGPDRETSKGFLTLLPLGLMDGKPCLQMRGTIFNMETMSLSRPLVALKTGHLHLPEDVEDDFNRRDERAQYINGLFALCWKSLVFVSYYYGENAYFDIWDTEKEKLMFRNKGPMAFGFPLKTEDGTTVNVWPQYSDKDSLIGIIPSDSDETDEEANPGIFVITSR